MPHTTEDLLLAAQVRKLAVSIRNDAYVKAESAWKSAQPAIHETPIGRLAPGEFAAAEDARDKAVAEQNERKLKFREDWHARFPATAFVRQALAAITAVADEIKAAREQQ